MTRASRSDDGEAARAIVNILEDTMQERDQLELTHKALLNILGDFDDATEELRRANRDLMDLDELKSEFVAMASHELRTPLTSITGFSSTMLENWATIPDAAKHQFVGIIDQQSQRLARLVDSLLTVSRIESGVIEANSAELHVCEALTEALLSVDAPEAIEVTCQPDLRIVADRDHIQQIVVNLVANAVKYGAAPIEVVAERARGVVTIRILDSGPGVPIEFVPHLFERFSQADNDPSRSARGGGGKGTGLGLAIVHALVRAQGGEAFYEPRKPQGSCFGVRFPDGGPVLGPHQRLPTTDRNS